MIDVLWAEHNASMRSQLLGLMLEAGMLVVIEIGM